MLTNEFEYNELLSDKDRERIGRAMADVIVYAISAGLAKAGTIIGEE